MQNLPGQYWSMAGLAANPLCLAQKSPSWAGAVCSGIPFVGSVDGEGYEKWRVITRPHERTLKVVIFRALYSRSTHLMK